MKGAWYLIFTNFIMRPFSVFADRTEAAQTKKSDAGRAFNTGSKSSENNTPRVVSVHSPHAAGWDFNRYPYTDHINYGVVVKMLNEGIKSLTGKDSCMHAWRSIFSTYEEGDIIAIKPNLNDIWKEFRDSLVTSPSLLNAILEGLVEMLRVPPRNIVIYDCTRTIPDPYRRRIRYPVRFVESSGSSLFRKIKYKTTGNPLPKADPEYKIEMSRDVRDREGNIITCYLPKVITSADHIINVPVFKSHQFVLASGALKNHYGTVRFSDGSTNPEYLHPPVIHESIADINDHPCIREKTRLVVMDALFGRLQKKGGPPDKWMIFNGGSPHRLFISRDPVALDSVSGFFIKKELRERKENYFSEDYLRIASHKNIGIYEMPDDVENYHAIDYRHFDIE